MTQHAAPESWLERWQNAEPVRLYLWAVASAVLVASVATGLLTAELSVAVTGVVSAVLMLGGTAAARRKAYAPATVNRLLDNEAEDFWHRGYARGLADGQQRTPDQLATAARQQFENPDAGDPTDVGTREQPRGPARTDTALIGAQPARRPRPAPQPAETEPREVLPWCAWRDERGRQCRLRQHPETTAHSPG